MRTIAIQGAGLVTPLGADVEASCLALASGLSAFTEVEFSDASGKPIVAATCREGVPGAHGSAFLIEALDAAIDEALGQAAGDDPVPARVFVPQDPAWPQDTASQVESELRRRLERRWHPESRVIRGDATCWHEALVTLDDWCPADAPLAVIAAADSLVRRRTLAGLERERRLKTPSNPDGLIPGEAAGALLVCRHATYGAPRTVFVRGLGAAQETARPGGGDAVRGEATAAALKQAIAECGLGFEDIGHMVTGVTGERFFFLDLNLGIARVLRVSRPLLDHVHPADAMGATGIASGVVNAVYATFLFDEASESRSRGALLWSAADGGARAVAVLEAVPQEV